MASPSSVFVIPFYHIDHKYSGNSLEKNPGQLDKTNFLSDAYSGASRHPIPIHSAT
jgi:hypothetical protein